MFGGGLGGAVGGLGGVIASTAGTLSDVLGQERANEANSDEAAKARNWSKYMSSSAHQREVIDLRLAGINPMLSAKLGGASTPGATLSPMQQNSAQNVVSNMNSIRQINAQIDNTQADTQLKTEQTNSQRIDQLKTAEDIHNVKAATRNLKASATGSESENVGKEAVADLYKNHPWLRKAKVGSELIKDLISPSNVTSPTRAKPAAPAPSRNRRR